MHQNQSAIYEGQSVDENQASITGLNDVGEGSGSGSGYGFGAEAEPDPFGGVQATPIQKNAPAAGRRVCGCHWRWWWLATRLAGEIPTKKKKHVKMARDEGRRWRRKWNWDLGLMRAAQKREDDLMAIINGNQKLWGAIQNPIACVTSFIYFLFYFFGEWLVCQF